VASSFDIGFRQRVEQFALPIPRRDVTVFRRNSFHLSIPAQYVNRG
jgi:hypothetical protein